jgi:hypothetical protein
MSTGPLVIFKSVPDFWKRERCGNKPNTVRLLIPREYDERLAFADTCMEVGEPATVEIVNAETGEGFFRAITDISQVGTILGQTMWCISWHHEDGDGTYTELEDES